MEIPDNITFTGTDAAGLQAAFQFVWDTSPTFRDAYNLSRNYVVSYDDIAGVGGNEPAYHVILIEDGNGYVRINASRSTVLVIGGVPDSWVGYGGYDYSPNEFRTFISERGFIAAEDFPSSEAFWTNQIGNSFDRSSWSSLPDIDSDPTYNEYLKWAYVQSGAHAAGVALDENFWASDFLHGWENSSQAADALAGLREGSIVTRELTLEERIAHEFAHGIIESASNDFTGGQSELNVIEFMNGVRADLGLPPLRIPENGIRPEDLFGALASQGYSVPTVVMVLEQFGLDCFAAGTMITFADGSSKPIESVIAGDVVLSYQPNNEIVARRVTQTFKKEVAHLLDVHGLQVTPGHVTLCGAGRFVGQHVPIIDILLSDGALVREDGDLVRIATNKPVGSPEDQFVQVSYAVDSDAAREGNLQSGKMRVGTLLFDRDSQPVSVLDCIHAEGMTFDQETGLVSREGGLSEPLYFFGELPRPEDYILRRSRKTLEGILTDGEWEGTPSQLVGQRLRQTHSLKLH